MPQIKLILIRKYEDIIANRIGQKSPYGQNAYRVVTNSGNNHGWYFNGKSEDHQLSATGRSVECLGDNLQKSKTEGSDPIQPAKLISAKHGDIVLDAMDGDIILKGDNIIIGANGIRNNNDGDIMLTRTKPIAIDASDVKIDASNVRIVAIKDFSIVAKCYGDIVAGFLNVTQHLTLVDQHYWVRSPVSLNLLT